MSTLNKIIKKYNQSDQHLIVKDKSVANLEADIEALLTEARIDELKHVYPESDYELNDLVMSVADRIKQLKENK